MADEPQADAHENTSTDTPEPQETQAEKQCRICFDGEDPELGRLIRPCLCKGSVSYVHVKCLHLWRNNGPTRGAFYRCPQCGYHYRFARTKVIGIGSNPIVVGMLSGLAFTLLLFCSSFLTTYLLSGPSDSYSLFSLFYPWGTFKDIIRAVACTLTDIPCDDSNLSTRARRVRKRMQDQKPTLLSRFVRRLLLGLPTVGAGGFFSMLLSLPMPFGQYFRMNFRRRGNGRSMSDFYTLVLLTVVFIGAVRALYSVFQFTEKTVHRLLLRAEDAILEVS